MGEQLARLCAYLDQHRQDRRERRSATRVVGEQSALLTLFGGAVPIVILDVSLTGCRVRHSVRGLLPSESKLQIPALRFCARVQRIWQRGDQCGWRFLFTEAEERRIRALLAQPEKM